MTPGAKIKAAAAALAAVLSMPGAAQAQIACLTKEERKAANDRYHHCMELADANLSNSIQVWELSGCNKFPQPMNCRPPYPQWDKDKKQCLDELMKGDGQTAAELARLKGEYEALERAAIEKNCKMEFRK